MASASHEKAVAAFLARHCFEIPNCPTVPPLDVAERDVAVIGAALSELATALGLECGVAVTRSLLPHSRGMVEIRQRLALLRAAVALACVELGVPERHVGSDEETARQFAQLFIRGRRRASQVT